LESKHQSIANSAIALWNSSFGNCQERLEYPERVEKALLRLRPIADLQLPFFPESLLSEEPVDGGQPIHFAETQNDSTNFFSSTSSDLVMRKHHTPYLNPFPIDRLRQFTAQVLIEVPRSAPGKRSRDETPEINKRKSRKRDSTPRLRHDDSQIQFEPIVSSPGLDTVLDSQLLTDRQKEVKERQEAEAAMFPDLRSSPRSKDKMQKNTASDAELPFHRSSSSTKLRQTTSPSVERQATPTIVPGGDEDNFVASSPTPTRSLHEHLDISAPPSSPPEAVFKERLVEFTESCDDSNIPSSPPEQVQEVENDTTTSIDPSAQIDPYAIENNPLSTFESSPDQREEPELEAPSSLLESFNDEHGPVLTPMGVEHEQSARVLCDPETEKEEIEPPGTPTRVRDDTPSQQTPKTPNEVFVDAQSNPIFSEQQTVNEDVFEDALSSPRLNMRSAAPDQGSSPLSNLDQSSMLRLMSKFDERSSQANGQGSFVEREQNLRMQTRSSLSKNAGHARDSPSVRTRSQGDATPRMPSSIELDEAAVAIHEPAGSSDQIQKSSSLPSLIPETPGKIPLMAEDEEEDLQDLDPDSTIIVDIRGLNWVEATFAKRSTHRKGSSKKRRHEEVTEDAAGDQGEVLNTQDAKAEGKRLYKI
jgi:hypothetical protein